MSVGLALIVGFQAACLGDSRDPRGEPELTGAVRIDTISLACPGDRGIEIGRISQLGIDSVGNLLILDRSASRVVVVAADSSCRTIGRAGGGPGEFLFPTGMSVTRDGGIVVRDDGRRAVSFFSAKGEFEENLALPLIEPLTTNTLVITSTKIVATGTVAEPVDTADGSLRLKEQFHIFSLSGSRVGESRPRFPLEGECTRPSAVYRGPFVTVPLGARLLGLALSDGRIIVGCTQSDSIWTTDAEGSEAVSLLLVLKSPRKTLDRKLANLMREDLLVRMRRGTPSFSPSQIDVPEYIPAWRQIVQTSSDRFAVLVIDSLHKAEQEIENAPPVRPRYSLEWHDIHARSVRRIALPRNVLIDPWMTAVRDRVYLVIELESGEEAVVRITLRSQD